MTDITKVPIMGKIPLEIGNITCIYKISFKTDKTYVYIGQTINLRKRIKEHRYSIKNDTHSIKRLMDFAKNYGFFYLEILETPNYDTLSSREQFYIDGEDKLTLLNIQLIASAPKTNISRGIPIDILRVRASHKTEIVGVDLLGLDILEFESIRDAGRHGFNSSLIQRCVSGFIKQHKSIAWFTKREYETFSEQDVIFLRQNTKPHRFSNGVFKRDIVAVSIKNSEVLKFSSTSELASHNFDRRAVSRIINSERYTHKGYLFYDNKIYEKLNVCNTKRKTRPSRGR